MIGMPNKKRIRKRLSDLKKIKRINGFLLLSNGSKIMLHNIKVAAMKKPKVKAISFSHSINFNWYPEHVEQKKNQ